MIKSISDIGRYPQSIIYFNSNNDYGPEGKQDCNLNILQCQKAIIEVTSVLLTVKNTTRQKKPRNNRGYRHSACYHLPQNSEPASKQNHQYHPVAPLPIPLIRHLWLDSPVNSKCRKLAWVSWAWFGHSLKGAVRKSSRFFGGADDIMALLKTETRIFYSVHIMQD